MYRSAAAKLLLALILICSLPITSAAQDTVLMDGESIFLTTGEAWTFDQGYVLTIKSVNQRTNEVWLELSLDGMILREGIFRERDTLVYSRDTEILNITLDTVYSSPSGELVTFTPVYQYLDPQLPAPEVRDGQEQDESNGSQANSSGDDILPMPGYGMFQTLATIALVGLTGLAVHRKR
ncbi:hypothetical protein PV02_03325 [Methanolobus chelungpuianus]|uniref:S-layer family duplication domain-containing protein n=2 Tax=Methanolobus chelungpuianus TaxID=502115 RepID=A0AAE3KXI8_9EURY|nr:hypothetical protein [Methanolobus chelungpuianus]